MNRSASAIAVFSIASFLCCPAFGEVESKTSEHRSYPGVRDLMIENIRGNIEVVASNTTSVEVDIETTLHADTQDRLDLAKKEVRVDATQQGGFLKLFVDGPFRQRSGRSPGYEFSHEFKVRLPKDTAIDLNTVNSNVVADGTTGTFKARTVNGSVELKRLTGSGEASTVNGAVTADFAAALANPVLLKSVNGRIQASFPASLKADVMVKAHNGGFYTDFDTAPFVQAIEPERRDGKNIWRRDHGTQVRVGGGGPQLRMETVNGDVLLKKH